MTAIRVLMYKTYTMVRLETDLRDRIKHLSPKSLTYSQFIENLLDFKQNYDMKEKVGVIGCQTLTNSQTQRTGLDNG